MRQPLNQSIFGKFRRLSKYDRLLVVEATISLLLASVAIALMPFRHIALLSTPRARGVPPPLDARMHSIKRVRWAVTACSKRMPMRAMCFEQGLTAHRMLRRRGIPSILYLGAAKGDAGKLNAHVWVRDGDIDVMGCENASDYSLMASFPEGTVSER